MAEPRREGAPRESWNERFAEARTFVWSTLTDPAVLVYRREASGRKRARVLMVEFFLFVREITREFYEFQGTTRAASLAYTTLLSLIPLLVAFTQVLQQYFRNVFPNFQAQIDSILNVVLPYQSPQLSYHLARFTENASAASTFGIIVFMIVAFRLFLAVEDTINQLWKTKSAHGYRHKIIAFTMLFFWGPLLMGLSFTTSGLLEKNRYLRVVFRQDIVFTLAPIVILFIAFTMLFWLVPSAKVRFSSAAIGGIVTTALFSLVRFGFGIYADYLFRGRLNLIYGTVGLVVIFLLALEVMWVVILLGVEISYVFQNLYGVLRACEQQIADDPSYDLYFALRALIDIVRHFERREDAPSAHRLAERVGATDPQMMRVLQKLQDAKLVKEVSGEWLGLVPGCDPDQISVEEVLQQVEGKHRHVPEGGEDSDDRELVGALFERIDASIVSGVNRTTIGDLVRALAKPPQPTRIEERLGR